MPGEPLEVHIAGRRAGIIQRHNDRLSLDLRHRLRRGRQRRTPVVIAAVAENSDRRSTSRWLAGRIATHQSTSPQALGSQTRRYLRYSVRPAVNTHRVGLPQSGADLPHQPHNTDRRPTWRGALAHRSPDRGTRQRRLRTAAASDRGWLTEAQIEELVNGMVQELIWERRTSHHAFSLAGAQTKTALYRHGERWGKSLGGVMPSTHILKPSMRDLSDQAINEHLCLAAARNCGLIAARSQALRISGHSVIAVQRYDRIVGTDGIRRVHQEDMHQACGEPTAPIYQTDKGGHSINRLARLVVDHSLDRDTDLNAFFDALAFNWMVCNTDVHSKNYSLLLGPDGVRFAPLYDIWSLLPYEPELARSHSMAMAALPDRRIIAAENPLAWIATAKAVGVLPNDGPDRVAAIAEAVPEAFEQAADELPSRIRSSPIVSALVSQLRTRGIKCLETLHR